MIKRFIRKISYFDTFGAEVKLNFNKRETHQSPFGGFCTILLVAVLSVIFVRGAIDLINKDTYTITSNELLNVDPPNRLLTSENFMVAFQVDSPITNATQRLLTYNFIAQERVINENGTYDKNELSKLNLVQCTTDHFVGLDDSTLTNKMLKAQLPDYYCLPLNYTLSLQGTYKSDRFLYGKISVEICNASDCYSANEIQQFYKEGDFNNFKINTIILNRVPNLNSENNYITYLYTDFYIQAQIGIESYTNIFLQEQVLSIDNSFIPGISQIDKESIFSVEFNKLIPSLASTSDLSQVAQFYIRLSQTESQYYKQFYRFDELISYVGGITKFLATLLGYFIIKYNQTGLQIKLANSLYQFDMPEKKKGEYVYSFANLVTKVIQSMKSIDDVLQKFKASAHRVVHMTKAASAFRLQSHPTILNDNRNDEHEEIQPAQTYRHQYGNLHSEKSVEYQQESQQTLNLEQDKKKYLDSVIKLVLESRKKLSFGVHFIAKQVTSSFKINKKDNYHSQLFERSTKMILRDMDILVMMSKLQEIEKIKHIVLNKTQRKVFNYLPKPIVSIQKEKFKQQPEELESGLQLKMESMMKKKYSSKSLLGGRANYNTFGKFKTLYEAYEAIALSDTREEQESQVNERLIELVEPTIQHSFNSLVELEKLSRQIKNSKRRRAVQPSEKRVQIMDSQQEIGENAQEEDDMDCVTLKGSQFEKNIHRSPQSQRSFRSKVQLKTTSSNRQQLQEVKLTKVKSKQDLIDIEICSS